MDQKVAADGRSRSQPEDPVLNERQYARVSLEGARLRRVVYHTFKQDYGERFRTIRITRLKLDVALPTMTTSVWIVFLIYRLG